MGGVRSYVDHPRAVGGKAEVRKKAWRKRRWISLNTALERLSIATFQSGNSEGVELGEEKRAKKKKRVGLNPPFEADRWRLQREGETRR